jgi:hypothetical protein
LKTCKSGSCPQVLVAIGSRSELADHWILHTP